MHVDLTSIVLFFLATVIAVIGWFSRNALDDLKQSLEELKKDVKEMREARSAHAVDLGRALIRLDEHDRRISVLERNHG